MAYSMVPNRFYPLYLLAMMYEDSAQTDKAIVMAQQILNKEVKIESRAIDEMRENMKQMLKHLETNK